MVVSYDEPHHPFTCPVEYLQKYQDFYYDLGRKPTMLCMINRSTIVYGRSHAIPGWR
jgi:hypothetical protein